jgi:4-hydroxy-tetrahydrodipicolinate synthase
MIRTPAQSLTGIHAATIVPMHADYSLDEAAFAQHIADVTAVKGIRGLLVNGHAGENFTLTVAEKKRVVEIARKVAPPDCYLVSGVNQESSLAAAEEASILEQAGADALLVFPPNSWALDHADDVVMIHHRHVLKATHCPLMIYGAPVGAGQMAYPLSVLGDLVREPRICAVKEGSWEVAAYEANRRHLKQIRPEFIVMGSGDEHLLTSYMIGNEGSQVSLAAVIPELLCDLWDASAGGDWTRARMVHEKIYPLSVAVYRDAPSGRATARLKACLKILGRLQSDALRPPQPLATVSEYHTLEQSLKHALS